MRDLPPLQILLMEICLPSPVVVEADHVLEPQPVYSPLQLLDGNGKELSNLLY